MKHESSLSLIIFIACLLAASVVAYFYFVYYKVDDDFSATVPVIQASGNETKKDEIIKDISQLEKYGTWPKINFKLSPQRGNPFIEKTNIE